MKSSYWNHRPSYRQHLSRRRLIAASGSSLLGAALLAACSGDGGEAPSAPSSLLVKAADETNSAKKGGSLKITNSAVATFDPLRVPWPILHHVYSELFRIKGGLLRPSRGELEGELAQSWEFSPDKLQLTLKLTDKAKIAPFPVVGNLNGRAMDSADVIASYERLKDSGLRREELANDINPSAPVASFSTPDKRTVVVKLVEPLSTALYPFATLTSMTLPILPREAQDEKVLDVRRTMLGSGPWYLADYVPSARYVFKRNPDFALDKRNVPFIDEIESPIALEYATGLAQFKTGALHEFNVRAEDVLTTKSDVPELEMMATELQTSAQRNFFGQVPTSPFRDERVRQAWSMSWDRDLWIDVMYNVGKFQSAGLPVQTGWSTAIQANSWDGWWLDPKSKDFGPNAKFYQHDIAEAKKLLSAAGYSNGVVANAHYPLSSPYGAVYLQAIEVLLGMAAEAGFKPNTVPVNYATDWKPVYQNGGGKFDGTSFAPAASAGQDPVTYLFRFYNSQGSIFYGFDVDGRSSFAGDPTMDDLTLKMRREFDEKRRMALVHELQRHEGRKMYYPSLPGGANTFELAWPALRNRNVWLGEGARDNCLTWLDQTRAPYRVS